MPLALLFTMIEGGANPPGETLVIENSGTVPMSYGMSWDAPWLESSQIAGDIARGSDDEISFLVDGSGLTAGELTTVVTVEAPGAVGSPVAVAVGLSIAPLPRCVGTPPPCAGRTEIACTSGCTPGPGCVGSVIIDCSPYSGNGCNFCASIVGCACDASMSSCSEAPMEGAPTCASQTNQTTCTQFDGCTWRANGGCTGAPTACETFDTSVCTQQPGCELG
jgi:hypothetical protein